MVITTTGSAFIRMLINEAAAFRRRDIKPDLEFYLVSHAAGEAPRVIAHGVFRSEVYSEPMHKRSQFPHGTQMVQVAFYESGVLGEIQTRTSGSLGITDQTSSRVLCIDSLEGTGLIWPNAS